MMGLLDVFSLISSVASKFGVVSMSIIDLEVVWRELLEFPVAECKRSKELPVGLGEEYDVSSSIISNSFTMVQVTV
jgi:hypothetical protein